MKARAYQIWRISHNALEHGHWPEATYQGEDTGLTPFDAIRSWCKRHGEKVPEFTPDAKFSDGSWLYTATLA